MFDPGQQGRAETSPLQVRSHDHTAEVRNVALGPDAHRGHETPAISVTPDGDFWPSELGREVHQGLREWWKVHVSIELRFGYIGGPLQREYFACIVIAESKWCGLHGLCKGGHALHRCTRPVPARPSCSRLLAGTWRKRARILHGWRLPACQNRRVAQQITVTVDGREHDGIVQDDESWLSSARRVCMAPAADPTPTDLTGDRLRFAVEPNQGVSIRPMVRDDLPLVTQWRQTDHVRRWWASDGEPTREAVAAAYGPAIDLLTPTRMWIAEVEGHPIGFLQDYRIGDYPDYSLLAPDPDAIGVDYAIGDDQWCGRGVGTRMLWAWMRHTRARLPHATTYFAAPDYRNAASRRMLRKVGFTEGVWFDEPEADGSTTTVVGHSVAVRRVLG